jgi:hypothetical protein
MAASGGLPINAFSGLETGHRRPSHQLVDAFIRIKQVLDEFPKVPDL